MNNNIISLFDLTLMLESYLDDSFGGKYFWVTAEISSINLRRGHCYLNLIDKDAGSAFPKAEMRGIIWQNNYQRINDKFAETTGFDLKQDISILCLVVVNYSPRYGLSLNIFDIKGEYTIGEMMLDRQKTIDQLKKTGLYEKNKLTSLPPVPQRIAALSAIDSKGFEDFANVLLNNQHKYKFNVKLFPVMLQGNKAAESIAGQMKLIETRSGEFDFVVLVRGGGGNVDLHCFNSYILAEAIANCSLPVVTGIGHTTDYTVADEVAAVHKETPTAVAQYIISLCLEFENSINEKVEKINRLTVRLLDYQEMQLEKAAASIRYKPKLLTQNENILLSKYSGLISSKPKALLTLEKASLTHAFKNMKASGKRMFEKEEALLLSGEKYVKAHDPLLLLKKGYSITRKKGKTIKNSHNITEGDAIETIVADGKILSVVTDKKHTIQ